MKKIMCLSIFLIMMGMLSTSAKEIVKRNYDQHISALDISGMFDVTVQYGAETHVEIEVDDQYLDYVRCEVSPRGTLTIGLNKMPAGKQRITRKSPFRAVVTLKDIDLQSIRLSDKSSLTARNLNSFNEEFRISLSGMSKLTNTQISAEAVYINVEDMSKVSDVYFNVDDKVRLKVDGMSTVTDSNFETCELRYDIDGMSKVQFSGNAEEVSYGRVNGKSKVNMKKFNNPKYL